MVSAIDSSKPIYGTPTTESVRLNFETTANEITELQNSYTGVVRKIGDIMSGPLTLYGPPKTGNEAATLQWTLDQLHSTVNTLVYVGDYDGATDVILTSGQPLFIVGNPLPLAAPSNSQYYFTVKTSSAGIGNQPPGGVTAGSWLISNGTTWNTFAMTAPGVTAQSVPVSPPITNVPGANVYDALTNIGANFLQLVGGHMTGDLILYRSPQPNVPLAAATKQYVDGAISSLTFLSEAPLDGFSYARGNGLWTHNGLFSDLRINNPVGWSTIAINTTAASNTANQLVGTKDNSVRWVVNLGGPTSAQNFEIYRFDNSGNMLDADWSFVINRTNGNLSLRHGLIFDSLAGAIAPGIYGRTDNNPIDPANDTLNIFSRLIGGNGTGGTIGLRGPGYPYSPNSVQLYAGSVGSWKAWTFDKDGTLTLPGSLVVPVNTWLSFALGSGAGLFIDGSSNFILNGNGDFRIWFSVGDGSWHWDAWPNFTNVMLVDAGGNLWTLGSVSTRKMIVNGLNVEGELSQLRKEIETIKGRLP